MPRTHQLKRSLLAEARALGFDACGIAPVAPPLQHQYYLQWIAEGRHGDMGWMERNLERRLDPRKILPRAQSIVCLGLNYYQPEPPRRGRIAKYALGGDYHEVLLKKLQCLCRWLKGHGGENRPYVDTGPVLEKPIAMSAGLGWQAKSTMILHTRLGTWLFLGEILTTLEFPPDRPQAGHCGKCTACIDVCPTEAITAPYQLDARKCIAYLTIEHKGAIPHEFRKAIGDRLFGCDICLDVCPWNRWAVKTAEADLEARVYPDLRDMLLWDESDFRSHFKGTPIRRLGRARWLRNVAVVLGNIGGGTDLPHLKKLVADPNPLIAEHASWAVEQIRRRG